MQFFGVFCLVPQDLVYDSLTTNCLYNKIIEKLLLDTGYQPGLLGRRRGIWKVIVKTPISFLFPLAPAQQLTSI